MVKRAYGPTTSGTAVGWGGNPPSAALYAGAEPKQSDGTTVYRLK